MSDAYRIALRPDDNGNLDDVVVNDVSCFRAEMMDNRTLWIACYLAGSDEEVVFWVHAHTRKGLQFQCGDAPNERPEIIYEAGSMHVGVS